MLATFHNNILRDLTAGKWKMNSITFHTFSETKHSLSKCWVP